MAQAARYPLEVPAKASLSISRPHVHLPSLVLIFSAWLVPALLSGFNTFMQSRLEEQQPDWHWILFNAFDWLLYAVLTPLVFRTARALPLQPPHLARNLVWHVGGSLGMCLAWAGLGTLLRLAIFPAAPELTPWKVLREFVAWAFTTLPFGVGVYFALVGIEHSLFYFRQARERETQAARLSAQLAEARLSALRMQLNPHFLFNSLNAIMVLVRDQETAAASRMLELLSDVLRHVLRANRTNEIALSAEVEFTQRYLAIEQVRFSDRLHPVIEIAPETFGAAVPRFLLLPLVENALRHGIARRAEAANLQVKAWREGQDLIVTIRDDGPGLSSQGGAAGGIGLANTRARLAALYGDCASLNIAGAEGGGVIVSVLLPYREAESDAQH